MLTSKILQMASRDDTMNKIVILFQFRVCHRDLSKMIKYGVKPIYGNLLGTEELLHFADKRQERLR